MRRDRSESSKGTSAWRRLQRKGTARWFVLLFALGLAANASRANELALLLNGKAYHMPHKQNNHLNENNWGAGLQYDFDQDGNWISFINASVFKDSNYNTSYYAGGGRMRRYVIRTDAPRLHVDAGFVAFLMHRMEFRDGDLFPGILPALSLGTDRVALNITYVPKVDPKMVELLFLQLKIRIGK